jgi:apolipoprotein D and lipocalin family protein
MYISFLLFLSVIGYALGKEYKAVDDLNVDQYLGKWYEVYGDKIDNFFQKNAKCSTANYGLLENKNISVLNKQIDQNGHIDSITGVAFYKEGDCCGYLTVELKDLSPAPYWVIELGPVVNNYYDYAIVSDDKALSLFVLCRNVTEFFTLYNDIVLESLKEFGFTKSWNSPQIMDQTNCLV